LVLVAGLLSPELRIVEQAAGHLRWEADYQPSQPVGSGFEPHWRPQPAKLPSFGGYSLETSPYLTLVAGLIGFSSAALAWQAQLCNLTWYNWPHTADTAM